MTTKERKRGGPFPDGLEQQEAQLVGPHPTWRSWRHTAEERLGISFKDSNVPGEPLLHEFYVMRRLQQKAGEINKADVREFWRRAKRQLPDFEKTHTRVIEFIIEKTPITSRS